MLAATYQNRRSNFLPLAYITVMCISGVIVSVFISINITTYIALEKDEYDVYLSHFGKEVTVGSTFSYLYSIFITVLMTINRLAIVLNPFNEMFTHKKVFIYSGIMAILVLVSLLIPYFSPCSITFAVNRMSFVSECAPNRHAITVFQNTYAIILPLSCMVINLGIIFHLRLARHGTYQKINRMFCKNTQIILVPLPKPEHNTSVLKMKTRRDFVMMRQTISIAAFLSIYEIGAFITKTFPEAYASLPEGVRDGYFIFRLESVALMNFFIYYMETPNTRRMLRRFLNFKDSDDSSARHMTMATVAPR
ncbi:hypothetical protein GCK72_025490 [Caenorhabditis remanei]|uniref:G-protein coupled receptors family 1 profile domain-containing protein n=1 Tax=Caenorhabditis remanei TaxID=31234 RepID=A0A6A5G2J8_CAERE|nr:hypothetical protein GCK72_025490 [Caenorhabditis remanei]KAF1749023.1 hypothetical protein GCK72_025490 [Caenorhabditis remanei]